ncbi:long-chain-fatty-acid--CoA ligase [Nocardioides sp. Root140]|uniref:long-chain-fatty-acid--CoA ligase n=1 Tax=Nocardioides sp. Root140 TaxID=1736460 RepID=UPI0006FD1756|nr:long-chain fatty acid--CoA ligase [Nocardioides sp. Root140]KQY56430.1 long-chain fatty acid--CoA ligase [Nocardioides sp. Root140]KRF13838.1 long-chain fatty acid--CoA ligase [Nocardioides sp. Soil797]
MTKNNLATILETGAEKFGDRTAVIFGDRTVTYTELNGAANKVANLLVARGIKPGDKVAVSCPNTPHFTIVYFGILKAGAVVVPLNVLLKAREISYHLRDSEAKAYFCFEGSSELAMGKEGLAGIDDSACENFFLITAGPESQDSNLAGADNFGNAVAEQPATFDTIDTDPDDTAVILYTSGTTGNPKGAELRHRNMLENARAGDLLFDADPDRPDTYLCVLPLFHSFGQTVVQNGALAFGGTIVMLPRFEVGAAVNLMTQHAVTFFAGVPTMYWALLSISDGANVSKIAASLRVAASGGAALPGEVHKHFQERYGVTILEGYGLSETSPIASFSRLGEQPRIGSIGTPIPGVQMRLLEPDTWNDVADDPEVIGEIAIKGHNVMKCYYGQAEATEAVLQDGWFRTGDLAKRDADGWYYIVDRSKDMIIRGGFNVYPREIEEVLATHPAVSLVAVVGLPHEQHGEEIRAYVIPADGQIITPEDLIAWAKEQMAAYKYPREVVLVASLPMTATGKILKRELVRDAQPAPS